MFNGKVHYNWPFSIAMLNYQRVILLHTHIPMGFSREYRPTCSVDHPLGVWFSAPTCHDRTAVHQRWHRSLAPDRRVVDSLTKTSQWPKMRIFLLDLRQKECESQHHQVNMIDKIQQRYRSL